MSKTKKFRAHMSSGEFQECLNALGLSEYQYAELVDVHYATINRRAIDKSTVPNEAAILLRILTARPELIPLAWEFSGLPEGGTRKQRGSSLETAK